NRHGRVNDRVPEPYPSYPELQHLSHVTQNQDWTSSSPFPLFSWQIFDSDFLDAQSKSASLKQQLRSQEWSNSFDLDGANEIDAMDLQCLVGFKNVMAKKQL